jgi:hypothetical protein
VNIDVADACGSLATAIARSAPYREYLHLISIGHGQKIAGALWLPQ